MPTVSTLIEILKAEAGATPGEWQYFPDLGVVAPRIGTAGCYSAPENAHLIALARNHIKALALGGLEQIARGTGGCDYNGPKVECENCQARAALAYMRAAEGE